MIRLWSIAKNTFLQTIRQPVFGALVFVTIAVVLMGFLLPGWSMSTHGKHQETDQKMMENQGLGTLLICGLFIAAFSAASAVSREIDDRTAQTVICKPVPRVTFVAGKFLGVAAATTMAFYLGLLVFLMTVRHRTVTNASDPLDWPVLVIGGLALFGTLIAAGLGNLVFGWTFASAAVWLGAALLTVAAGAITVIGKGWQIVPFAQGFRPSMLAGVFLVFMAVQFFVAVAVAASTRLSQAMTLLLCFAVYVLGLMHPFFFGPEADPDLLARAAGWLLPNLTYFDPLNQLAADQPIPAGFVGLVGLYWLCLTVGVLGIGAALFQTRQLESQTSSTGMPPLVSLLAWAGRAGSVVAVVLGLRMVLWPAYHGTLGGLAAAAVALAGGVFGWYFWTCFGRGRRWTYWLAVPLAGAHLVTLAAAMFLPPLQRGLREMGLHADLAMVTLILTAAVLLVLLLPGTRHHFSPANR
jgi:hypothetical protein